MQWTTYSTIILLTIIIITIYLPLSCLYYYRIIKPNAKLPLFRIRRPNFIFLFLIIMLSNAILRTILSFLISIQIVHPTLYDIILQISTFYGSITVPCIRMWLLYYDTKSARKQRKYMLSKHLSTVDDIIQTEHKRTKANTNINRKKRYRNIWGNYKPLLFIAYSIVTIFFLFDILLTFTQSLERKPIQLLFYAATIMFWTVLLCLMWGHNRCCCCKNKSNNDNEQNISLESSFRDDWNLLLEMTLLWSIGVVGALIGIPLARVLAPEPKAAMNSCIACICQTSNMIVTCYCPYSILSQLKTAQRNNTKLERKSLKKILSKKSYFFAFVEHLQHELSIENLTFLVEIWQFKYEEKYDLTSLDKKDMKKAILVKDRVSQWSREHGAGSESSFSSHNSKSYSLQSPRSTSGRASLLMRQKFLDALPWCDLPLAQSLSMNPKDKWAQCMEIFGKFIGNDSYYAVNIGYEATEEIYYNYDRLLIYKEQKPKDVDIASEYKIVSDEEFNTVMMGVFDYAVGDILENLGNSYSRFVRSDTFKMLNE